MLRTADSIPAPWRNRRECLVWLLAAVTVFLGIYLPIMATASEPQTGTGGRLVAAFAAVPALLVANGLVALDRIRVRRRERSLRAARGVASSMAASG